MAGIIVLVVLFGFLWLMKKGRERKIICPNPNCGFKGLAKAKSRGSNFVLIVLLFFFIIPGILYMLFKGGYTYSCPNCGIQIGSDA
jgi:DNA-directed RNA polymerase subunit RPC12/RpoP